MDLVVQLQIWTRHSIKYSEARHVAETKALQTLILADDLLSI